MQDFEKQKLKQYRIISAFYDEAIEIRNNAIELSKRFKSIKAAMRIEDDLIRLDDLVKLTLQKIDTMLQEFSGYSKEQLELHELELLKIKDKIIAERNDLKHIQDDIYNNRLN